MQWGFLTDENSTQFQVITKHSIDQLNHHQGPKPAECLHLMRSFPHMYMIRGNHEHMVVRMGSCPGTYEK